MLNMGYLFWIDVTKGTINKRINNPIYKNITKIKAMINNLIPKNVESPDINYRDSSNMKYYKITLDSCYSKRDFAIKITKN